MPKQIQGSQFDFSYGEIDVALKRRDDHPARKAGLRQMANARILNAGGFQNRSGRSAVFPANLASRIEEVTMSPGNDFKLAFGFSSNGELRIYNSVGAQVAAFGSQGNGAVLPWTALNVNQIVYAVFRLSIYITFPGMIPQVVTWDGVSGWSIADYAEQLVGGQKRTPFYRITKQGVTIVASAQTGSVVVTASEPIFTAAQVGTRIRYINRQLLITIVPGPYPSLTCGADVEEALPGHQTITSTVDPTTVFSVGDVVRGSVTGSIGQVFLMAGAPTNSVTIQLLNTNSSPVTTLSIFRPAGDEGGTLAFTNADTIVGPGGSIPATSPGTIDVPAPTTIWDEEVMNPMRGYPRSVFVDQFRLGFCDFPAVPEGISWSAINSPTDLYVGADPASAMFEIAPAKVRVFYVVPGPESSELVFCDKKVYYIPINETNPLKPGSVAFKILSSDGSAQVQPRAIQETVLYINAGGSSVMAVVAPGAYYRPFNVKSLTEFHSHLFDDIVAIAAPTADSTFEERYTYVLNGDGSIVCGKYRTQDGQVEGAIGWGPWSGAGTVKWISAWNSSVLFTTQYFGATICEKLDDSVYMDANLFVNALPTAFAAPPGKGPLWWIPNQSVSLMDQGTRYMGVYQIDADGFIVPQGQGGEDLTLASLAAGQIWTMTAEPFAPDAQSGADAGQRMKKRQYSYFNVYVINSTGFYMAGLFSSQQLPTSPPLGTIMNQRNVPAYNAGENALLPPTQRETVESYAPVGSTFDPRAAIIKDTPGPLLIAEFATEVTI
jgi:hypothetical protein